MHCQLEDFDSVRPTRLRTTFSGDSRAIRFNHTLLRTIGVSLKTPIRYGGGLY